MIVVYVDVRKNLLQHCVEYLTCLQHIVYSVRTLSLNNVLLHLRIFPVNVLRHSLIHRYRQNKLIIECACLYLVCQPRLLLEYSLIQIIRLYVVYGESYFLIFIILIIVVIVKICTLFCRNHALHKLHRGIVLARILVTLAFYDNLA